MGGDDAEHSGNDDGVTRLRALLTTPEIREALFIASPEFEGTLDRWLVSAPTEGARRVERTVVRYLTRMAMRPTPFGLFAGVSVGTIDDNTCLELPPRARYRRHARLDMGYLDGLVDALSRDTDLRASLRFRPNTSIYPAAGRLRYVEISRRSNGPKGSVGTARPRAHQLVDVADSPHVREALSRSGEDPAGATIDTLAAALAKSHPGRSLDSSRRFICELIGAQLLIPTVGLALTGAEPLTSLVDALRTLAVGQAMSRTLEAIQGELAALNDAPLGADPARWRSLIRTLEMLPGGAKPGCHVQVDMTKPAPQATLSHAVVAEIARGVQLLHRLIPASFDPLAGFRSRFVERYQNRAVPLLEVLDDEVGIGLEPSVDGDGEPLLHTLNPRGAAGDAAHAEGGGSGHVRCRTPVEVISRGERDAFLLARIEETRSRHATELVLDDDDVAALAALAAPPPGVASMPLPGAFAAVATLVASSGVAADRGDFTIHLIGFEGPSGARPLGRFCHHDTALREHVLAHLRGEEALDPEAVYAEIVHLPDGRVGNVLARPLVRDAEIVYLGDSGAPSERQILAADLLVSIEGGRIVLRARHDGRRVVPRLTSAHNFRFGLPVYRFLGVLQSQGCVGAGSWRWGALDAAPFLPRVRIGRIVLALARWRVRCDEWRALGQSATAPPIAVVRCWRERHSVPRRVAIVEVDHALPIDLDDRCGVEELCHRLEQGDAIVQEVFPAEDELCVSGPEGRFAHELIVPYVAPPTPLAVRQSGGSSRRPGAVVVSRRFAPGSEWLFAKLYGGTATADRVLIGLVAPLVTHARDCGWIDRWFFIRYGDPESHLRVRLHGAPDVLQREVVPALHDALAPFLGSGALWRVQFDTYEREVERYGGEQGIELAERLFEADSDAALEIVRLAVEGGLARDDRWRVTLLGIDALFGDLGLGRDDRRALSSQMSEAYRKELSVDSTFGARLGARFRAERAVLGALLDGGYERGGTLAQPLATAVHCLRARSERLAPIVAELRTRARDGRLSISVTNLASSFGHMHAVRVLRAAARTQEMVLYDFLCRLYDGQAHRREVARRERPGV